MLSAGMVLNAEEWAEKQFGRVEVGDERRTRRLVDTAARMMRRPNRSLPEQMQSAASLKASYRLLAGDDVTYAALMGPHWQQTLQAARQEGLVLMVQDTTEVNYTHHPRTTGLGAVGDGKGKGYLLHTVLAMTSKPRQALGIANQRPFLRQAAPSRAESCAERQTRPRESQVWSQAVEAVGEPPDGCRWVQVGDRYSDIFKFMDTCRRCRNDFLIRVAQDRRVRTEEAVSEHLFSFARGLPAQGEKVLQLPARHGKPAREAHIAISYSPLTVLAPVHTPDQAPLAGWLIRVWEPNPPSEVAEPLEWTLFTSVATETLEAAWERVNWYTCRWLVEDYHQCLKSGCRIEQRQLQDGERLIRLLGILAPMAVRLSQLREVARLRPELLAKAALPPELVQLVAALANLPVESLTVGRFWREVARLGGYLGRRGDGPPGWKTLWRGWLYVQTLLEGVQLSSQVFK